MSDKFKLGVGQAHEIEMAMNRVGGWNEEMVKTLCTGNHLAFVRDVLTGEIRLQSIVGYIIDLDANPFLPAGWKVERHQCGGQFKFDPTKVEPYLVDGQKAGKVIGGHDLQKELEDQPVFNANLLDFYLAHPESIPEEWKAKTVFFWGTVYRGAGGNLGVRYLYWSGGRWRWRYGWLGRNWGDRSPAAVLGK